MSIPEATTVDVLIARLETHPDEFFKREAVATYDGEKLFAHTKWRRITTTLLVNKAPDEQNLWIDLFSQDERQRFRDAIFKAIRAELDTQIMRVIVGEDPLKFDSDGQRMEEMKARHAAQMAILQQGYLGRAGMPGTAVGAGLGQSLTTAVPGGLSLGQGSIQNSAASSNAQALAEIEAVKRKYETQVRTLEKKYKTIAARAQEWFSK